ncbi:MAG: glycosyltransferase [Acidobacteriota bacterium]|nr:glycosyltransferase [Acidobacteriota bacterium]
MRILFESNHVYPAGGSTGTGLSPNSLATGGSSMVHDLLARALAELGHQVFYLLPNSRDPDLPDGVTHLTHPIVDVDVFHHYNSQKLFESKALESIQAAGIPWVVTCHNAPGHWGGARGDVRDNWIFVSKTLAEAHGSGRYVWNGVDPEALQFSRVKQDYLLFISNMRNLDQVYAKGLDLALEVSARSGCPLRVIGSCRDRETIDAVTDMCRRADAHFLGDVRGIEKARLLASAKALLFTSRLHEAFGLPIIEAAVSGTPVISLNIGAAEELVSVSMGFVCADVQEMVCRVDRVSAVDPETCRAHALERFHYHRTAREYLTQYQLEMEGVSCP